jgi:hypothetical protein
MNSRTNIVKTKLYDKINRNLKIIKRPFSLNKTFRGTHLSRGARALAVTYKNMINKSPNGKIFVTHSFISKITEAAERQNSRINKQLAEIFNITYYYSVIIDNKKYRNGFVIFFQENGQEILNNPGVTITSKPEINVGLTSQICRVNQSNMSGSLHIYIDKENIKEKEKIDTHTYVHEKSVSFFISKEEIKEPIVEIIQKAEPPIIENLETIPIKHKNQDKPLKSFLPLSKEVANKILKLSERNDLTILDVENITNRFADKSPNKPIYGGTIRGLISYLSSVVKHETIKEHKGESLPVYMQDMLDNYRKGIYSYAY